MTATVEQVRTYRGPAVLSFGFRPFFPAGAAWAATAVALWLPMLTGQLALPTAFTPLDWHVHELLYGYVPAVVAGFLLTAVPNWTGRLPVVGTRLLALFVLWLAGRLAILFSQSLGPGLSAAVDLAFLAVLGVVIAREILAGRDKRNLKLLALVALLFTGNATFHLEAALGTASGYGTRIGIAGTVLLIMLIGGRIVPSFTRNWLVKRGPGRLPVPFGRFDNGVVVASGTALLAWTVAPENAVTAGLSAVTAVLNMWRLGRWAGDRTLAEPLVTVLHAGFAFRPLGFALVALGIVRPDVITSGGALHAWTAGTIGVMTLAVMTRASLGHTGRTLTATWPTVAIYLAVGVAAIARIAAAVDIMPAPLLHLSATAWVLAFGSFVVVYGPLLTRSHQ